MSQIPIEAWQAACNYTKGFTATYKADFGETMAKHIAEDSGEMVFVFESGFADVFLTIKPDSVGVRVSGCPGEYVIWQPSPDPQPTDLRPKPPEGWPFTKDETACLKIMVGDWINSRLDDAVKPAKPATQPAPEPPSTEGLPELEWEESHSNYYVQIRHDDSCIETVARISCFNNAKEFARLFASAKEVHEAATAIIGLWDGGFVWGRMNNAIEALRTALAGKGPTT